MWTKVKCHIFVAHGVHVGCLRVTSFYQARGYLSQLWLGVVTVRMLKL